VKIHTKKIIKIIQNDNDTLKKAANEDLATRAKQIDALVKENAELKDAAMEKVRTRLEWLGAFLCLGAIGSFVLSLYIGFTMGRTISPIMGSCGILVLGFARLLPKIEEYGEIGCILVAIVLFGWLLYHAFQHVPKSAISVPPITK